MSPEFCLRWNNHRPNLVNVFKELLQSGLLVDVTLAAGGEYIHAHRLVLSACSLYFKELFAVNPCQHPIVILKDFHIDDLKTVVDFIYQGEVNVAQERLPHVLKTAETLRIKGLAENPRSFEEFQAASAGQATTRLGSLSSNQQQSGSSLSDSREQSIEGEEGLQGDPTQHSTPPHKKRKVGGGYDHQSSEENEGIRVKEEPSNSSGVGGGGAGTGLDDTRQHQDDTGDEGATQTQSGCRLRDPSLLIAPSDGGDSSVAVSPPPGGGGGSPTPPPSLNNNGDTDGGAVGLLQQHHQGQGGADWPLSLVPWWASVLPTLARQQQQQHNTLHHNRHPPSFLPPPTTPPTPPLSTPSPLLTKIKSEQRGRSCWPGGSRESSPGVGGGGGGGTGWSTGASGGRGTSATPPVPLVGLDHLSLATALGKEVSPQMVQALQAVALRRESFSSAAKLYSVSVTTLWRYSKKLNLLESRKESKVISSPCPTTTFMP